MTEFSFYLSEAAAPVPVPGALIVIPRGLFL